MAAAIDEDDGNVNASPASTPTSSSSLNKEGGIRLRKNRGPTGRHRTTPPHDAKIPILLGASAEQNSRRRRRMEDVHVLRYSLSSKLNMISYLAVFDGHGGRTAAEWCGENLHNLLSDYLIDRSGVAGSDSVLECINSAFQSADDLIAEDSGIASGCTAAVCLIDHENMMIYTGNCGDARAVLFRNGQAIRLSYDHKGSDPLEQMRVLECGGFISNDRVSGLLAITRSLGDSELKDFVSGRPFTTAIQMDRQLDSLIIVACDGLWDVVGDQEACELAQESLQSNATNEARAMLAADALVNLAIEKNSFDNISVVVCQLHSN